MSVKGWESAIRVATSIANVEGSGTDEPAVQSVSPSFGNNIEALFEIGSRVPTEVKEGNIDISLDITANYQGDTTWSARAGVGAVVALTEYYVAIYPKGAVATRPEVRFLGKFGDWSLDISQDGVLTETVTFIGRVTAIGTAWIG